MEATTNTSHTTIAAKIESIAWTAHRRGMISFDTADKVTDLTCIPARIARKFK